MDEWIHFWNLLRTRHDGTDSDRGKKALALKLVGQRLVREWTSWAGQSSMRYYMHCLASHIHHQVCNFLFSVSIN